LELHKDAYKKLKSLRWELVSKGIYELTQMQVEESYGYITKFINDKRPTIRKQAEIAVVTLKEEGISYFLDHTKSKISEWQQLKLLDVVRNKEDFNAPSFRLWLTSKNNYVVLFSLRLIKYFNQNDASASLIQLLNHKNNIIKREAITCIKDFNVKNAIPVLQQIFGRCNTDTKLFILEAIAELGSESELNFLKQVETNDKDFTVRNKAIRAINTICPESILPTNDIEATLEDKPVLDLPSPLKSKDEIQDVDENISKEPLASKISLNDDSSSSKIEQVDSVLAEDSKVNIDTFLIENELSNNVKDIVPENKISEELQNAMGFSMDEIGFLPIVTDKKTEKEVTMGDEKNEVNINDLNVIYESCKESEVKTKAIDAELNLNFLPIITGNTHTKSNQLQIEVDFEEVKAQPKEIDINNHTVIYEIVNSANPNITIDDEANASTYSFSKESVDYEISDFKVEFEEVSLETETIEEPEIYLDWNLFMDADDLNQNETKEENSQDNGVLDTEIETQKTSIGIEIPTAKFYDDDTLEKMVLLENMSDLGDHREIPFLKSMLTNENSEPVIIKINNLINRFSKTNASISNFKITDLEAGYSVFQELFDKSDFESKLMLLDEIAKIGDEKELPLLNNLVNGDDKTISKKAAMVTTALHQRLASLQPNISDSINEFLEPEILEDTQESLFEVGFEVGKSKPIVNKGNSNKVHYGSTLFDQLVGASSKLYNKFNK
jgi:HEAT repeat protein/glucan-binding YG repeat protein